jgi:FkbM family methyltransferase
MELFLIGISKIYYPVHKLFPFNTHYPKGTYRKVMREGLIFNLDISDYQEYLVYFDMSADSSKPILNHLPTANGIIIDIGANIGYTALLMAKRLEQQNVSVIAFEPYPSTFIKLEENLGLNKFKNIKAENIALGSTESELMMVQDCPSNSGGYRAFNPNTHIHGNVIKVTQTALDTYLEGNRDSIIFIKIDVEGYEFNSLLGAMHTIRKHMPMLYIELCDKNLRDQGSSAEQLTGLIETFGYNTILNAQTLAPIESRDLENCSFDIICKK